MLYIFIVYLFIFLCRYGIDILWKYSYENFRDIMCFTIPDNGKIRYYREKNKNTYMYYVLAYTYTTNEQFLLQYASMCNYIISYAYMTCLCVNIIII